MGYLVGKKYSENTLKTKRGYLPNKLSSRLRTTSQPGETLDGYIMLLNSMKLHREDNFCILVPFYFSAFFVEVVINVPCIICLMKNIGEGLLLFILWKNIYITSITWSRPISHRARSSILILLSCMSETIKSIIWYVQRRCSTISNLHRCKHDVLTLSSQRREKVATLHAEIRTQQSPHNTCYYSWTPNLAKLTRF